MKTLQKQFDQRQELIAYVRGLAPWAKGLPAELRGGRSHAEAKLANIDPLQYAHTRNHGDGQVTKLSAYLHHGILSLNEVRNVALIQCSQTGDAYKFVQELAWRDYWQRILNVHPDWAWQDAEPYKTGFMAQDYSDDLPEDIVCGNTGVACLDHFIQELIQTGYIHNHARMYLASYVVHFRRIKWQAGAAWFLHHLLDGDVASNNLSWQWIASTFSNKPYIFNLENVEKYFGGLVNTSPDANRILDASYEALHATLFPNSGVLR